MKIIVDACVWSLALRRINPVTNAITNQLRELIQQSRVQMLGSIRQELLTGIVSSEQFEKLKFYLRDFPDLTMITHDYEIAAKFANIVRAKGIQGSHVDFLICAAAVNNDLPILTIDKDFQHFAKYLPIKLIKQF